MKHIFILTALLFGFCVTAQDYKIQWDKVAQLETEGLTKPASQEVDKIYAQAKKDKNEAQILKTFFFRAMYVQVLEEDAQIKIVNTIRAEKETLSVPAKAIMESLYAGILYNIYSRNTNQINRRSHIDGPAPENFLAWSRQNFTAEIEGAYMRSIISREVLYKTPLAAYREIIDYSPVLNYTGRSLYDFLVEQYINSNDTEWEYMSPDTLRESVGQLFGDSDAFATYMPGKEVRQGFAKKVSLLEAVEGFYMQKKDEFALRFAVLRRLEYVAGKYNANDKHAVYRTTAEKLALLWKDSPFEDRIRLVIAGQYAALADKITCPDCNKNAVALCDTVISGGKHYEAIEAENLKAAITRQQVSLSAERVVIPGQPILAQVSFTNTDTIKLQVYRIAYAEAKRISKEYKEPQQYGAVYMEKVYALPEKDDHFRYTTEIVLPPLERGYYLLVITPAPKSAGAAIIPSAAVIHATEMVVTEQDDGKQINYQVSGRKTGKPLKNVAVTTAGLQKVTDKRGRVAIAMGKSHVQREVLFTFESDTLDTNFYDRYYSNENNKTIDATVRLYTDRAIYRPGQEVFFKGIVVKDKGGVLSTVNNIYVSVTVSGPDNKDIAEFRLPTNEFGSFTGSFIVPKNAGTGEFEITADEDEDYEEDKHPFWDNDNVDFNSGSLSFSVEEYKRPTFEVKFNPVKNDIWPDKDAEVNGVATTFSGVPVQNAKVKYMVKRTAVMRSANYHLQPNSIEIAKGEAKTDDEGRFIIVFPAKADPALPAENLPLFTYTVHADVTDMAGETQMAEKQVQAAYHSLSLKINSADILAPDTKNTFTVDSHNLNGEFRAVEGDIKIYRLTGADRVYKERPWAKPDIQTIPQAEFERLFPYFEWMGEPEKKVQRREMVYTVPVNTGVDKDVVLKTLSSWQPGSYEAEFTAKDSTGREMSAVTRFRVKDRKGMLPVKDVFLSEITNNKYLKDGYIDIEMRSGLPLLYVNVSAYNKNRSIFDKLVVLKGGRKNFRIPVSKKMEKDVLIRFDYVWENDYHQEGGSAELTDMLEKLEIETQSISTKLQPGSTQEWSFRIKNSDNLPAEVLVSMYDASLDQFAKEYWEHPNQKHHYDYNRLPYKRYSGENYPMYISAGQYLKAKGLPKKTDTFYTYGFDINTTKNIYLLRAPKGQVPGSGSLVLSGVVNDSQRLPIPGVNVTVDATGEGVQTDFDGFYTLRASKGDRLRFSYIGMLTQYFTVGGAEIPLIVMGEDSTVLEDVVVEAYRNTTRALSNVAVTTVTSKTIEGRPNASYIETLQGQVPGLEIAAGSGQPGANSTVILRGAGSVNGYIQPLYVIDGVPLTEEEFRHLNPNDITSMTLLKDASAISIYGNRGANGVIVINTRKGAEEMKALQQVEARKNFNETAFFYPQLKTDNDGRIAFTFTVPEALTEWKLRLLAHNKKVAAGYIENTFRTQKDLMIVPNMPRFLREKDTVLIFAKVINLTGEPKSGNALLQLCDALTMQPADVHMLNTGNMKPFTIPAKGSTTVSWKITVPEGMQGVQYKVLAKSGDFTDGEENILPVLPNSILLTESIPLWVKPETAKEYTFNNLKNNTSATLRHVGITLEYTSNPAWVALQSLPYLMEYEHECAEQVFSRYYANTIAAHIISSNPKIAEVFAAWRKEGKPVSKLEQNEELKSIILAETPWMLDSQSEEEKKNRLALLFELDKMKASLDANLDMLAKKQKPSGGFAWFDGGVESEYITRHILSGFGHLGKLGTDPLKERKSDDLTRRALQFTDMKFLERYERSEMLKKDKKYKAAIVDRDELHYLYTRSFYLKDHPLDTNLGKAVQPVLEDIKTNWLKYGLYEKGLAALVLHRFGKTNIASKIVESLKQSSSNNEEWGMYWIENRAGLYWNRAPIETQALLIEAFTEIKNDVKSADAMKIWLIKQKQNKNWPTTKSTSEAVYALLMTGTDWLSVKGNTLFTLGGKGIPVQKTEESAKEAETGYMKLQWKPDEINNDMALVIENKSAVPGYGGFYWQYFEDLDKIKPAQEGVMNISKELYLKAGDNALQPITAVSSLKIGDRVTMRLELVIKEDMEFVHLKDLRAAAFEPVDVLSGYHWQEGMGYYRTTRDAATHFFFDSIKKGTYVLEYDVRVNNAGVYSNGITTIQSMYAPEFSAHAKGIRVKTME